MGLWSGFVSGMDCTLNVNVNHRLTSVNTRDLGVSSFTRTMGSTVTNGLRLSRRRTRRLMRGFFTRRRTGTRTTTTRGNGITGRTNRRFLTRGTGGSNVVAAGDNLRCRVLHRNGNGTPGTASRMRYRCRNALVSNAGFSDSCSHNRATAFPLGRMVTN